MQRVLFAGHAWKVGSGSTGDAANSSEGAPNARSPPRNRPDSGERFGTADYHGRGHQRRPPDGAEWLVRYAGVWSESTN
jgi:hypothetical protein